MTIDPTEIDLVEIQRRYRLFGGQLSRMDIDRLVAAVEALRERVAGYESLFDSAQKQERPWIEVWRKATDKYGTLPDYGKLLAWLCDRAETAEACVTKLEQCIKDDSALYITATDKLRERVKELEIESAMRFKRMEFESDQYAKACVERDDWQSRARTAKALNKEMQEVLEDAADLLDQMVKDNKHRTFAQREVRWAIRAILKRIKS